MDIPPPERINLVTASVDYDFDEGEIVRDILKQENLRGTILGSWWIGTSDIRR